MADDFSILTSPDRWDRLRAQYSTVVQPSSIAAGGVNPSVNTLSIASSAYVGTLGMSGGMYRHVSPSRERPLSKAIDMSPPVNRSLAFPSSFAPAHLPTPLPTPISSLPTDRPRKLSPHATATHLDARSTKEALTRYYNLWVHLRTTRTCAKQAAELEEKLESSDARAVRQSELLTTTEQAAKENSELQGRLAAAAAREIKLEQEVEGLQQKMAASRQMQELSVSEVNNLKTQVAEVRDSLLQAEHGAEVLSNENATLVGTRELLEERVAELDGAIETLQREKSSTDAERGLADELLDSAKAESKELAARCEAYQSELAREQAIVQELQARQSQTDIDGKMKVAELEEAQHTLQEFSESERLLKDQVSDLRALLERSDAEAHNLREAVEALTKQKNETESQQVADLTATNIDLQAKLGECSGKIAFFESEQTSFKEHQVILQSRVRDTEQQLSDAQTQLSDTTKRAGMQAEEYQKAILEKETALITLRANHTEVTQQLEDQLERSSSDLAACKDELTACNEELTTCKDENTACKAELLTTQDDLTAYKDELAACKAEHTACKDELSVLQNKLEGVEGEKQALQAAVETAAEEKGTLQAAIEAAEGEKATMADSIQAEQDTKTALEERLRVSEDERAAQEEHTRRAVAELDGKLQTEQEERLAVEENLKIVQDDSVALAARLQEAEVRCKDQCQKLEELTTLVALRDEQLGTAGDESQVVIGRVQEDLAAKISEVTRLQQETQETEAALEGANAMMAQLQQRLSDTEAATRELEGRLEEKDLEAAATLAEKDTALQSTVTRVAELEGALGRALEAAAAVGGLNDEVIQKNDLITLLQSEVAERERAATGYAQEIEDLGNELGESKLLVETIQCNVGERDGVAEVTMAEVSDRLMVLEEEQEERIQVLGWLHGSIAVCAQAPTVRSMPPVLPMQSPPVGLPSPSTYTSSVPAAAMPVPVASVPTIMSPKRQGMLSPRTPTHSHSIHPSQSIGAVAMVPASMPPLPTVPVEITLSAPAVPSASGRFVLAGGECPLRGLPVWASGDKRLFAGAGGRWLVGAHPGSIEKNRGCVRSAAPHGNLLPHAVARWEAADGKGGWVPATVHLEPSPTAAWEDACLWAPATLEY